MTAVGYHGLGPLRRILRRLTAGPLLWGYQVAVQKGKLLFKELLAVPDFIHVLFFNAQKVVEHELGVLAVGQPVGEEHGSLSASYPEFSLKYVEALFQRKISSQNFQIFFVHFTPPSVSFILPES